MFVRSLPMDSNVQSFSCNPSSDADVFLDIVHRAPMEFIRSRSAEDAVEVFTFP